MFCPNCGTQNPETAQVCAKCNFNLKGAAAPKFKGTMLMMNQQTPAPGAAAPAPAPVPQPPQGVPPSAQAGAPSGAPRPAAPSKLKGTMVGVAPPMPHVAGKPSAPSGGPPQQPAFGAPPGMPAPQNFAPPAPPPAYAPPPQQNFGPPPMMDAPPPPPPAFGAPPPQQQYGAPPPQPQHQQFGGGQGVNPLGGTMAADPGQFNPYAGPPAGGYAPPPPPPAYGGAPDGQYGAPPPPQQAYGAPPGGYGAPAPQYGAPPGGGYGDPNAQPQGGFGSNPPQAQGGFGSNPPQQQQQQTFGQPGGNQGGFMAQASQAMTAASAGGLKPTPRNAVMTMGMPFACLIGGILLSIVFGIIGAIAGVAAIAMIGSLLSLVGFVGFAYFFFTSLIKMVSELKSVTNNAAFAWWPAIVPIYGIYWMVLMVPQEVTNAKRAVGAQEPVRSPVIYFFLFLYALASDINDIAAKSR